MDSKKIRTRQEFNPLRTNPKGKRHYIIGLDIGYSGTKVFYENGYFVFPSYAKKIENGMMPMDSSEDMFYQEEGSDDIYMVGYNAQNMINEANTNDTDGELYSRKRYSDKRFKIICNVAMALATSEKNDGREIFVQTGLPSSYVEGDKAQLIRTLCKPATFYLKKGNGARKKYTINIKEENVDVIPQPAGSLYSVITQNNGEFTQNAKEILCGNVLVMDIGFGTYDFYGVMNRAISCTESTDEYGMRQLLSAAAKQILKETNEDIRIASIQKNLQSGTFTYVNEDEMKAEEKPINPYLESANEKIFTQAMEKAKSVTNAFRGYKYLIITGGTGEMWFEDIKKWLEGMKTLKIISGNTNDHLPFIYSNVRGYYMFRYMKEKGR